MNQLFDDLDNNEDLNEHQLAMMPQQTGPIAFSKQEEIQNQFAVVAPKIAQNKPASNPFSKKRGIEEVTPVHKKQVPVFNDVEMEESKPKPVDDSMATENFHSVVNDSDLNMSESAQKQVEPKHSSIEDDWQKLKLQSQLMETQQAKQEAQSSL